MRNKEKDTINIVIGKHMAELRAKFNLSQKEICQVIGVNRNTYKDYEIGIFCLFFLRYACVKQL